MKPENAIEVKNITKKFKIYYDKGYSLKDKMLFWNRNKHENRWVLNGISFDVKIGEAIGLVGKNGCGKSTTLKLLTKIMYPDTGTIDIKGRVSSLIELGAGFHPDMTGIENIYTNAAIFGLTRKEIDRRLDDIVAFSEMEQFIDNPVRTYSSGMYMRLAFSVAINVDADVLLIDEILAVGDVNFQTKCFEKLKEIKANGTTIVIVSHSLEQIEQICEKSYWIEEGLIKDEGIPKYVHERYLSTMEKRRIERINEEEKNHNIAETSSEKNEDNQEHEKNIEEILPSFCDPKAVRMGNREIEYTNIYFNDIDNKKKMVFSTGETLNIVMDYKSNKTSINSIFGIRIFRDDGTHCYGTNTLIETDTLLQLKDNGNVTVCIEKLNLLPGKYLVDVSIHSQDGVLYDDIRTFNSFRVIDDKRDEGICRLDNIWIIDGVTQNKRVYK